MFSLPVGVEASGWETPDPDFHQPLQTDDEINDIIDFSALSDVIDESDKETPIPFILAEVEESFDTSTSSDNLTLANYRKSKVKRKEKSNLSTEKDFSGDQSNSDLSEGEQNNPEVDTGSPIISIKHTRVHIDDSDEN